MIVEVRSYRIKPGHREEFIQFFETRAVPALRSYGMKILGPLIDLENPNKFVWLRSFPSLAERERMRYEFYEGELWKNELNQTARTWHTQAALSSCCFSSSFTAAVTSAV